MHGTSDLALWNLGTVCITEAADDIHEIRQALPKVPLIILSKHDNAAHALEAIRLGARGHIPASSSLPVMIAALRLVLAGGVYAAPLATDTAAIAAPQISGPTVGSELNAGMGEQPAGLTKREEEVLALLRQGKANKLIAYDLGMSENTVKVHVRRIIKKLQVMNRTEAAFFATEWLNNSQII